MNSRRRDCEPGIRGVVKRAAALAGWASLAQHPLRSASGTCGGECVEDPAGGPAFFRGAFFSGAEQGSRCLAGRGDGGEQLKTLFCGRGLQRRAPRWPEALVGVRGQALTDGRVVAYNARSQRNPCRHDSPTVGCLGEFRL